MSHCQGALEPSQPTVWAEQFANGDRTVGDRLGDHVRRVLRRRFLSLGVSKQEADDLVQECVTLVFAGISGFNPSKGSLDSWLSGYARNVARTWWRGSSARRQSETELTDPSAIGLPVVTDLRAAGALESALAGLSLVDQELLQMRFGHGYSFDEIAEMSGMTSVNARNRVSRAVECLRKNPELRRELRFC